MTSETLVRPPLVAGDRLTQPEFHRHYELMPPGCRARLIDGIVYIDGGDGGMASPVSESHGRFSNRAGFWLVSYESRTAGIRTTADATLILGPKNEPQPDQMMYLAPEYGGGVRIEGGYCRGVPEFAAEIAVSSRSIDLGPQRADYERAGVPEYVVFATGPEEIFWHVLRDGQLVVVPPDADGIYRSRSFPGLWLDPAAFWAEDGAGLIATLERGLASPEYAEFAARLRAVRPPGD